MDRRGLRWFTLAAATAIVFGAAVMVLLRLLPAPRNPADYLTIGTMATLVSLVAVFGAAALITSLRLPKRRR